MKSSIIVAIILCAVATITFLILLLLPRWRNGSNVFLPSTTGDCRGGRVYDSIRMVCVLPSDAPCQSYADCEQDYYCNGRCVPVDSPQGGVGQYCPCTQEGTTCVIDDQGYGRCRLQFGQVCTVGDQCVTGYCGNTNQQQCQPGDAGCRCSRKLANGLMCINDSNCISDNCSQGFCQPNGMNTGDLGSACNQSAPCNEGTCWHGLCTIGNAGYNNDCRERSCAQGMYCDNAHCIVPEQCLGSCIPGFQCVKSECRGESGALTSTAIQCLSGRCDGGGIVSYNLPLDGNLFYPNYSIAGNYRQIYQRDQLWTLDILNTLRGGKTIDNVNCFTLSPVNAELVYQTTNGDLYRNGGETLVGNTPLWTTLTIFDGKLYYHYQDTLYLYPSTTLRKIDRLCNSGWILNGRYTSLAGVLYEQSNVIDTFFIGNNGILVTYKELIFIFDGILNSIPRRSGPSTLITYDKSLMCLADSCVCT